MLGILKLLQSVIFSLIFKIWCLDLWGNKMNISFTYHILVIVQIFFQRIFKNFWRQDRLHRPWIRCLGPGLGETLTSYMKKNWLHLTSSWSTWMLLPMSAIKWILSFRKILLHFVTKIGDLYLSVTLTIFSDLHLAIA